MAEMKVTFYTLMNREEHIEDNQYYHVYNRGNNRERIFGDESDYEAFIRKMKSLAIKHSVDIPVYVLMPNHYHLIAMQRPVENIVKEDYLPHRLNGEEGNLHLSRLSSMMGSLATSVAKRYNLKYGHVGHLFQGPFRYRIISDDDLWYVASYIHLNPVRAGLVRTPEEWLYSNFADLSKRFPSTPVGSEKKETFDPAWQGYAAFVLDILEDEQKENEFWMKVERWIQDSDEGFLHQG